MPQKFVGEFEDMFNLLDGNGFLGFWDQQGDKYTFWEQGENAQLNWVRGSGSLWVQGPPNSRLSRLFSSPEVREWGSKRLHSVFIVFGRDKTHLPDLLCFLRALGCAPKTLAATGGGGMTIIEALEKSILSSNAVDFGIVLLTGDDFGYLMADGEAAKQPRARQNVIFEMGMLMAHLGRERVALLLRETVEIPSDIHGVIYLPYREKLIGEAGGLLLERFADAGIRFPEENVRSAFASCANK